MRSFMLFFTGYIFRSVAEKSAAFVLKKEWEHSEEQYVFIG